MSAIPRAALTVATLLVAGMVALPWLDVLMLGAMPVLQAALPVLCLVALGLAVVAAFLKWRVVAVILLAGAITTASTMALLVPGSGSRACVPGEMSHAHLTVMSLNLGRASVAPTDVAEVIRRANPDMVALVEVDEFWLSELLADGVEDLLPHRTGEVSAGGVAGSVLLAKHPLASDGTAGDELAFDHPVAVVRTPGGPVRVAVVHPFPPLFGADQWRHELAALAVFQREAAVDMPLVLGGDFNATATHPAFRRVTTGMVDTATVAGWWPRATWPANSAIPAFAAIDHVVVRGAEPVSWDRLAIEGTDHFGIVASIALCTRV